MFKKYIALVTKNMTQMQRRAAWNAARKVSGEHFPVIAKQLLKEWAIKDLAKLV